MEVRVNDPGLQATVRHWDKLGEKWVDVRGMLDDRYDDMKSGKVQPLNGEAFFEHLRRQEEDLLKEPSPHERDGR